MNNKGREYAEKQRVKSGYKFDKLLMARIEFAFNNGSRYIASNIVDYIYNNPDVNAQEIINRIKALL